ncbi:MAG: prenyltransferase/squalene oxidase repeat-containing protein [Planctomycetota bacterium]
MGTAFRSREVHRIAVEKDRQEARQAVERALRWLAAHQARDGGWDAAAFHEWCHREHAPSDMQADGAGKRTYDVGVSGLALCAFLGAGYTNRGDHEFAPTISRGLKYLKDVQDPEGCFGPQSNPQHVYNHALATLAMVEAFGMTGSPIFRGPAQRSLDFAVQARDSFLVWPDDAQPGGPGRSVTAWMTNVITSAHAINAAAVAGGKPAPLRVDGAALDGVHDWVRRRTDPVTGRVGCMDRFPPDPSEAMTAAGILLRIYTRESPAKSELIQRGVKRCLARLPVWNAIDGSIDIAYWHFATQAMHQVGGESWATWKAALATAVVETQRRDTDPCAFEGSWDPVGPGGPDGGRVYSTALMALCLEAPHLYERVYRGE